MNQLSWFTSLLMLGLTFNPSIKHSPINLTEASKEASFQDFIEQFEQASFPLELGIEQLKEADKLKELDRTAYQALEKASRERNINRDLRKYIPGRSPRFGRIPPDAYEPFALLANNGDYIAVIVAGKRAFSIAPSYYKLITYTPEGEVISTSTIAKQLGIEEYATATINKDLSIATAKHRVSKTGKLKSDDHKTCEILPTGEIYPLLKEENHPIFRPQFKRKKQSIKNAKASIY